MASPMFEVYDRNLRRLFWICFIDDQLNTEKRNGWRASLVVNAHTGQPIVSDEPEPDHSFGPLQLATAVASG